MASGQAMGIFTECEKCDIYHYKLKSMERLADMLYELLKIAKPFMEEAGQKDWVGMERLADMLYELLTGDKK